MALHALPSRTISSIAAAPARASSFDFWLLLALLLCYMPTLQAQGMRADYRRAGVLKEARDGQVYHAPSSFQWLEGEQSADDSSANLLEKPVEDGFQSYRETRYGEVV